MPLSLGRLPSGSAERVRLILAERGLTIAAVARASRLLPDARGRIPHNFYSFLRKPRFSPSLHQLVALSAVTQYQLVDWLTVFGFSLDNVPRFQATLPALRTVELDSRVYQRRAAIPWFYDLKEPDFSAPLVPLSQWLAPDAPRRLEGLFCAGHRECGYAKIGSQDAYAFPELLPGSIVRFRRRSQLDKQLQVSKTGSTKLFFVEHSGGLSCSRLYRPAPKKIVLCSRHLPYAPVELQENTEAVVLGVADLEIRPLRRTDKPSVPPRLGRFWTPAPLSRASQPVRVGEFIRRARQRSGLSFREASERTRWIAKQLLDSRYYCSPGALSDYEARWLPPRRIHKLISICAVYFASAAELLELSGATLDKTGQRAMPDEFLSDLVGAAPSSSRPSGFLKRMERRFKRLPGFLHRALPSIFGLPDISVRDVFWAGGMHGSIHSYSAGAVFLVVDHKRKIPRPSLSSPIWAQPAYVLQRRDGTYLWGFCSLQNDLLILRSCLAGSPKLQRLPNRVDAEVIGKVVGIVRTLQ